MYYSACTVLETADTVYEPGDVIPEFTSWNNVVQRAHLNQGNVERIHGEPPADARRGRSKADLAREAAEEEERERQAAEEAASPDDPDEDGTDDRAPAGEGDGEDGDPYAALKDGEIYSCPGCDGSVFTSGAGLRKHLKKAHGGEIPARKAPKKDDAAYAKKAPPPSKGAKHVDGLMSEFGAAPSTDDDDDE